MNVYHVTANDRKTAACIQAENEVEAMDSALNLELWKQQGLYPDNVKRIGSAPGRSAFTSTREVVNMGPIDSVPCLPSEESLQSVWFDYMKQLFSKW